MVWIGVIILIILVIENIVTLPTAPPYFLIWTVSKVALSFFSVLVWMWIWFWIKGIITSKNKDNDLDF